MMNKISNFKFQVSNFCRRRAGFTLLELLVVISIIAILVTIGISSFTTVQKKSRDSKRKSDIKEVQHALEQYYSVCGYQYLIPTSFYSQGIICSSPSIAIMPTTPADPVGITSYYCSGTCDATVYTICTNLETEAIDFCVKNQQ